MDHQVPPSNEVMRESVARAWNQVTSTTLDAFDSQTRLTELRERVWSAEHDARMAAGLEGLPGYDGLRRARADFALAQAQIDLDAYVLDHA